MSSSNGASSEKVEGNDSPPPPTPSSPGSPMQRRSSQMAIDMYGPVQSSRQGRPSMIMTALSDRQSKLQLMDIEGEGESEEDDVPTPLPTVMGNAPENEFDPLNSALKRRQTMRRISLKTERMDTSQFVQVKARDVSYHVVVQADSHSKQTVLNQSVCYFTYEFFLRLRNLISKPKPVEGEVERYSARGVSDLFLPYTKKTILQGINLVLNPGKSYLVLG